MAGKEHDQHHFRFDNRPQRPSPLPPDLADFLRGQEYACLTQASDQGTVFLIKAPRREIASVQRRVPIALRYELYEHPQAPVIRIVTRFYDQPSRPLALETFVNVQDEQQRADFAALANQDQLYLLFYDETLTHRLSKGVGNLDRQAVGQIVAAADRLCAAIPADRFDFDQAKADVMRRSRL